MTDVAPSKNAVYDQMQLQMLKTGSNLAIGSDANGDMYYRASSVLARLAKGSANHSLFMNADATAPEWGNGFKVGSFTRVLNAANAKVSYTGVGFKTKVLFIIGNIYTTSALTIGFTDGTAQRCLIEFPHTKTYVLVADRILMLHDGSGAHTGTLYSYDDDGFTITWGNENGGIDSTGTFYYLAFR